MQFGERKSVRRRVMADPPRRSIGATAQQRSRQPRPAGWAMQSSRRIRLVFVWCQDVLPQRPTKLTKITPADPKPHATAVTRVRGGHERLRKVVVTLRCRCARPVPRLTRTHSSSRRSAASRLVRPGARHVTGDSAGVSADSRELRRRDPRCRPPAHQRASRIRRAKGD
jgi:hypothetical protein